MSWSYCAPFENFETITPWPNNRSVTAIVAVHTPDGYVIGADGRQIDSKTKTIESDTAQKIFAFESETVRLAYAWTGTTQVYATDQTCLYDLARVTKKVLPAVELFGRSSWADFIFRFCEGLRAELPACIENSPNEIAKVILVGFFKGVPCLAEIKIAYINFLFQPEIQIHAPDGYKKRIFTGAKSACSSRYQLCKPQNNMEAIRFVKEYLQDCIESAETDCQAIGGHIHIGVVTPIGFSWIIPPL